MRREIKLIILVFVLVVGPALALSFLAARVLESWQIVLQRRMAVEAGHVLDEAVAAWDREVKHLQALPAGVSAGTGKEAHEWLVYAARMASQYSWIEGVLVYRMGTGLIYPPPAGGAIMASHAPLPLGVRGDLLPRPSGERVGVRGDFLPRPSGERVGVRGSSLDPAQTLATAGAALARGDTNSAIESFAKVADGDSQALLQRDPEEGFFYDLVALRNLDQIFESQGASASGKVVRAKALARVLEIYDELVVLQRESVVEWLARQPHVARELNAQWRERMRTRELGQDERGVLEGGFQLVGATIPEGGVTKTRLNHADFLIVKVASPSLKVESSKLKLGEVAPSKFELPSGAGVGGESPLVLAFQFNESALVRHLNVIFAIAARNTEIRVRCQIGAQDKAVPILATRQLSVPFGSIPVVATPEDVPAFLANVRLQTQLYRVGGGLLLISVVAGIWLMWREVSSEMRLARERSDFAATVSHDLRTPLSSMRMLAESLYLGNVADEGKRKKFLATIIKESDRLSRLTDRALYFIRYGQGALRYQFTEGDFGGVVREAVENFVVGVGGTLVGGADVLEVSDEKASPRVVVEIEPDLPQIRFDAGAMEQVVYNLLDNAVKYSREGEEWPSPQPSPVRGEGEDSGKGLSLPPRPFGERVGVRGAALSVGEATIHVKLVSEAGQIILSVEDQGVGLSSEEVQQVLNPYARGRRAGRLNARGVGLGLALCQHVVQAHGGRIQIRSVPGQGSTFSVILPV